MKTKMTTNNVWYNFIKIGLLVFSIGPILATADEYEEARKTTMKALLRTDAAKKSTENAEEYVARKVSISKSSAAMLGALGSAAYTGSISTESTNKTKIEINDSVYIKPDIYRNLRNSETKGVLNLKISF